MQHPSLTAVCWCTAAWCLPFHQTVLFMHRQVIVDTACVLLLVQPGRVSAPCSNGKPFLILVLSADNNATSHGAAICATRAAATLIRACTFSNTHAAQNGGAVWLEESIAGAGLEGSGQRRLTQQPPPLVIDNCTFPNTSAASGGAVGLANDTGELQVSSLPTAPGPAARLAGCTSRVSSHVRSHV